MESSLFKVGAEKKRPVPVYECAVCHAPLDQERVPIAVRVAAFLVPKAARDRRLDEQGRAFDITDVGLPEIVRELIDAEKHPDGHVYIGVGCFARILNLPTFNAAGEPAPLVPLDVTAQGIAAADFTGREHRSVAVAAQHAELYNRSGVRVNPDSTVWVAPAPPASSAEDAPSAATAEPSREVDRA